jgi:A-factor type gamma-butyrolactone 1'-reductase (1S-forming)
VAAVRLLEGKVALVTGAAGGIGRAAGLLFAREGAKLVLADRDADGVAETARLVEADGGEATFVVADVTVREDVREAVQAAVTGYGRLDCAFNNAGVIGTLAPVTDYPEERFAEVMDVNVRGIFTCLQEEIPVMLDNEPPARGAIVNTSSGLGMVGAPYMSAYVASKHAVVGITQTAALEQAAAGLRINAVLPGIVDTAMPATLTEGHPDVWEMFRTASPIGRLARPEEIAEAAAWLLSDRASFVNGHGLVVDGGILSQ